MAPRVVLAECSATEAASSTEALGV
jgi:hypothetical protein